MTGLQLRASACACSLLFLAAGAAARDDAAGADGATSQARRDRSAREGRRLFERETFGGNGRTCLTCHGRETGTISPEEVQARYRCDPTDPLFLHDGSDDGDGHGVSRILEDATILVEIQLPPNVRLGDAPGARSVVLRRGIPTTLNTPALDPVLMQDGRQSDLAEQAAGAIADHTQSTEQPTVRELRLIAEHQRTAPFFSSPVLEAFARGGPAPGLPHGRTEAERRGRRFFEDLPQDATGRDGLCAECHSGPMLNETNEFLPFPVPPGTRFQSVLVSELNTEGNPVHDFIFDNADGTETVITSPDPGRALITGVPIDFSFFDNVNAFKIPTLRGAELTAPYFHDNSAKTLEEVVEHYARFFEIVTDPDDDGPEPPGIVLTDQDQSDIVAYLKLL
jgi:cytochrome c peroxidase